MNFFKDPDAVWDYSIDWAKEWLFDGDTVVSASTVIVGTPNDLSIDLQTHTATSSTVWISGGSGVNKYKLTTHVTSAEGREDDLSWTITMKEK